MTAVVITPPLLVSERWRSNFARHGRGKQRLLQIFCKSQRMSFPMGKSSKLGRLRLTMMGLEAG